MCERGHLNPHRVTGDLVESQSNFTLNIVVVSLFLALFCALRRVGMKPVLGKGQYEPKWKQKQWRKKGSPASKKKKKNKTKRGLHVTIKLVTGN